MAIDRPLVSVGLPVYNGGEYIRDTLDALIRQDYPNLKIVISDNASSDDTQQICQEYARRFPHVHYSRNDSNVGAARNFNKVFELSSGKYFMWAACHDLWEPTMVSRCVEPMEADPGVVLSFPLAAWIEPDGRQTEIEPSVLDTRTLDPASRFQVYLWGLRNCYVIYGLIRADALRRTPMFMRTVAPDNIILAELSFLGPFALVPERLFYLRRTADYGDWNRVLPKMGLRPLRRWDHYRLYWQFVYNHLCVVRRNGRGFVTKAFLMINVIACAFIRYWWIFTGIQGAISKKVVLPASEKVPEESTSRIGLVVAKDSRRSDV